MTLTAIAQPTPEPVIPVYVPVEAAKAAITALALAGNVSVDDRVVDALAGIVSSALGEVRSADPDDCRWVTLDHQDGAAGYAEGCDTLAEALGTLAFWLRDRGPRDATTIAIRGPHPPHRTRPVDASASQTQTS